MTIDEYINWLFKIGMGWLGWSPQAVRQAHIQELYLAYEGKVDMLKACYGGGDEKDKKNKPLNSVEEFDRIFGVR